MNILIVTQYFWPESFLVNGLATELKNNGHTLTVLTGLPNYPTGKFSAGYGIFSGPWVEIYKGVKILRVPIISRGSSYFNLMVNYFSFIFFGTFFSFFRVPKNIDVIFCFGVSPITACLPAIFIRWLIKKPLVLWVQDLWPDSISAVGAINSEKVLNMVGLLVQFIYRRCDLILTQSEAFRGSIIKWGGRCENIKYLPNWAEPFVTKNVLPNWIESLKSGFRIGFAGNIGKAQDIPNLIETAFKLIKHTDIQWVIVGDGSEKKWLDQEIKSKGLEKSMITVGYKAYEDMLPFFKSCDVLLVSLTDKPIFSLTVPSKVQAYMASARPIISTVAGEGTRVIEMAQAGLTVEPGNASQLVEAILKLKSMSPSQRQQLGENGLNFFKQNFDKNIVIKQLEFYMQDLIKKNKPIIPEVK
ncbi:MAG: glycosyltransferase family 4 protein [Pseudobdellovibrio sp.]